MPEIQPHIMCKEGDIAPNVLLPGDPGRVLRMAGLLDESKEVSFNREYRVVTGTYKGMPVTICSSGIGGPAAAIAIEELIRIGAKRIIRVGSCGSMQEDVHIGDVVIPDSVVREDNTMEEYVPPNYPAIADPDLFQALKSSAHDFHAGPTMSKDALYAPAMEKEKEKWSEFGVLAQEMEGGTVLTLSRLRKIQAAMVLLVVNEVGETDIPAGIRKYSEAAKADKGELMEREDNAVKIALEALKLSK